MKISQNLPHVTLPLALSSSRMNLCNRGAFFIMEHWKNLSLELLTDYDPEGNLVIERFVPMPSYKGQYEISTFCRVRSLDRTRKGRSGLPCNLKGRFKKIYPATNLYLQVSLCKNGKSKIFRLHRLLALAFIPNPLNKPEVNHKNGIKTDNRLSNLEWATKPENAQHAFDMGLHIPHDCTGIKNGRAKLTEKEVLEIISLFATCSNKGLGKKYNLTATTVRNIRYNKLWKHIPRPYKLIPPSVGKKCPLL